MNQITTRITPQQAQKFGVRAAKLGLSKTELNRRLILRYLESRKEKP